MAIYVQVDESATEESNVEAAQALLDEWGVGRKGFDDGLVWLISLESNLVHGKVSYYAGAGFLRGYMSQGDLQAVIDEVIVPAAHAGAARRRDDLGDRRGGRRDHAGGDRSAQPAAAGERRARPDRRADHLPGDGRLRLLRLAPRGRRPRGARLRLDPDGRPAGRHDAAAGDRGAPGKGDAAFARHDADGARQHRPDRLPEPGPDRQGEVRRRAEPAARPGHRGARRGAQRRPAGGSAARRLGPRPPAGARQRHPLPGAALVAERAARPDPRHARGRGGPPRLVHPQAVDPDHALERDRVRRDGARRALRGRRLRDPDVRADPARRGDRGRRASRRGGSGSSCRSGPRTGPTSTPC